MELLEHARIFVLDIWISRFTVARL